MSDFRLDTADDRVIRCGGCGQQVGAVILGAYPMGRTPPRLFTFFGTGWHRGTDDIYRLERHARDRVRVGKVARSAHPRVPSEGGKIDHLQSPDALDMAIECGRCRAIGVLDPAALLLDGRAFIPG